MKNNYPDWLVEKEKEKFLKGDSKDVTSKEQKSDKDFNCVLVFPFIGKKSVKLGKEIKRIFSEAFPRFDVLIAYRNFKVGTYFGLKATTPALFSSNLVYDFRCSEDGEVSYIGTTTRHLWKRIEEHLDPKKYSAIKARLAECDKCCEVKDLYHLVKVRKRCFSPREAKIAESMIIADEKPSLNKQKGAAQGRSFLLNIFK